jgi:hypothetical protein
MRKCEKFFFVSLKSMKKGVGSGVGYGSGSISQRYGSGDPDPDPHQNVTDPNAGLKNFKQGNTSFLPPLPFLKGSPLLVSFHEYTTSHPFPTPYFFLNSL